MWQRYLRDCAVLYTSSATCSSSCLLQCVDKWQTNLTMVTSSFDAAIWQFRTLQLLLRFRLMISLRRTVHTYGRCCRSSPSALTNNPSRVTHHLLFICVAHCRGFIVLYMMCKLLCAAFSHAKTGCLHAAAFKPAKTGCLHALLEAEYMCKICHFNLDTLLLPNLSITTTLQPCDMVKQ